MRLTVLVGVAALAGCTYDPKIPSGVIACSPGGTHCPTGTTCAALPGQDVMVCLAAPSPTTDGSTGGEAAVISSPDARTAEAAPGADAAPAPSDAAPADAAPSAEDAPPPPADVRPGEPLPPASSVPDGGCYAPGRGPEMVAATGFCIDSTEVTNRQYLAFLEEGDLTRQPGNCPTMNKSFVPLNIEAAWPPVGREDHPVVNVDWCDAAAFCQWAGKRLCGPIGSAALATKDATNPMLGRWASACTRAGTWKFPYGPDPRQGLCNVGQGALLPVHTAPVASLPGCQGGYDRLYDMVGNVEEWVDACRTDPARGEMCAVVGGRYVDSEATASCARSDEDRKTQAIYFRGFRCCWP